MMDLKRDNQDFHRPPELNDWDKRPKRVGYAFDHKNAHDHDDAIYVEELADGNILAQVHIADVAAYLEGNEALIALAVERRRSHYGRQVRHMLGQEWADFLSLNCEQDEYKASLTFEVVFSPDGELIKEPDVYKSRVHATHIPVINDANPLPEVANPELYEKAALFISKLIGENEAMQERSFIMSRDIIQVFNALANVTTQSILSEYEEYPLISKGIKARSSSPIRESIDLHNHLVLAAAFSFDTGEGTLSTLSQLRADVLERHQVSRANRKASPPTKKPLKTHRKDPLQQGPHFDKMTGASIDRLLLNISPANFPNIEASSAIAFIEFIETNPSTVNVYKYWPVIFVLIKKFKPQSTFCREILKIIVKSPQQLKKFAKIQKYPIDLNKSPSIEVIPARASGASAEYAKHFGLLAEALLGPPQAVQGPIYFIMNHDANLADMKSVSSENRIRMQKDEQDDTWDVSIRPPKQDPSTIAKVHGFPENRNKPQQNAAIHYSLGEALAQSTRQLWPHSPLRLPLLVTGSAPLNLDWNNIAEKYEHAA